MRVKLAVFADCANVTHDGKLNIMGVFQNIYAPQTPCRHHDMIIVIVVEAPGHMRGTEHLALVTITDPDGKRVGEFGPMPFAINPNDVSNAPQSNLLLRVQNLDLPQFGPYEVDIHLDGEKKETLALTVVQMLQGVGQEM